MSRTLFAALLAAVVVGGAVAGLGVFLGFPTNGSLVSGAVAGLLSGLLLLGASRRAETFHPTDPGAHLADHSGEGATPQRPTDPDVSPDGDHHRGTDTDTGA